MKPFLKHALRAILWFSLLIAFGVIMGIRTRFETPLPRAIAAGVAFMLLGLAVHMSTQWGAQYRRKRRPSEGNKTRAGNEKSPD